MLAHAVVFLCVCYLFICANVKIIVFLVLFDYVLFCLIMFCFVFECTGRLTCIRLFIGSQGSDAE